MSTKTNEQLTEEFNEVLRHREFSVQLTWTLIPSRDAIQLYLPGKTAQSKPVKACPLLVADEGQTHADLLELLAKATRIARS